MVFFTQCHNILEEDWWKNLDFYENIQIPLNVTNGTDTFKQLNKFIS